MKSFYITLKDYGKHNNGIHAEFSLCEYYGIHRTKHDNIPFNVDSDINYHDKHISVKSARFTLMSGKLCKGKKTFDEIWQIYENEVVSNVFTYVALNGKCYEMNLNEFKKLVYNFCTLAKDTDNTIKIRAKHETNDLIEFLENL